MGAEGWGGSGRAGYAVSEMSSSDYASSWRRGSRQGVLILVTFLIEFLLLVFVVIIEYFLRCVIHDQYLSLSLLPSMVVVVVVVLLLLVVVSVCVCVCERERVCVV